MSKTEKGRDTDEGEIQTRERYRRGRRRKGEIQMRETEKDTDEGEIPTRERYR